ncbi:uncharacterized protein LDX57_008763 [Aspergillus melleus]|uniref:uncharacterized protein n=1 Tax=Aspergillus melleus TaxID=138277 RepID=UPI001E8D633F|nr:uncharacterized protein LDX57_008763 [Aspergillus melleus]KAH8431102.1 hypothetical protein LDX57_008763 [Aspergillus melleus]
MGYVRHLMQLLAASPLLYNLSFGLHADIRADSNRDGYVDVHEESDLVQKLDWDKNGAIFLPNIGDTDLRCEKLFESGNITSFEDFAACHDASDDVQRAPRYMARLATVPAKNISDDAWGTIEIHEEIARKNVRIFREDDQRWNFTTNDYRFSSEELKKGLKLGIDARDTRRPGGWDGRVEVHLHIQDGKVSSDDVVRLRVAPVLLSHSLQRAATFVSVETHQDPEVPLFIWQHKFVTQMKRALETSHSNESLELFNADDVWVQDYITFAYTSMPGSEGPITLQINMRSSQGSRAAGQMAFRRARKHIGGSIYSPGGTRDEVNSMGNVITIPPYKKGSKSYPAGRIVAGSHGHQNPHIYEYLRAQEVQDPLLLDADWLAIGHIDEFLQFVPAPKGKSAYGWALLVADPSLCLEILEKAKKEGHGSALVFSRKNETKLPIPPGPPNPRVPGYSIDELLKRSDFIESNQRFAKRIKRVVQRLMKETGIRETDVHPLPMLFQTGLCWGADRSVSPDRNCSTSHATPLHPGVVSGVVRNESMFLAPNPWGPVVGGVDILQKATNETFERIGARVSYIDDWFSHHVRGGEVHSGVNCMRNVAQPWWETKTLGSYRKALGSQGASEGCNKGHIDSHELL